MTYRSFRGRPLGPRSPDGTTLSCSARHHNPPSDQRIPARSNNTLARQGRTRHSRLLGLCGPRPLWAAPGPFGPLPRVPRKLPSCAIS